MPTPDGKVRWGISSTGWLSEEKMMPAIQRSELGVLAGLVSRRPDHARAVADRFGIPKVYPDMAAMLADPQIDAVYNALPTGQHVPVVLQAVAAGKPILCEKPLGMDAEDIRPLLNLPAGHPQVMEAFMVRHHPQWAYLQDLVTKGDLGKLRCVQTSFCYFNDDPGSGTNRVDDGGGALLFVGCYTVLAGRLLFGRTPERALMQGTIDPRFGTDTDISGILDFGAGQVLNFYCSTHAAWNQHLRLIGDRKWVHVDIPYNTPETDPTWLEVDASGSRNKDRVERVEFPVCDHYAAEADAFARAVLDGAPAPYSIADAAENMRVIRALQISMAQSRWVPLTEVS